MPDGDGPEGGAEGAPDEAAKRPLWVVVLGGAALAVLSILFIAISLGARAWFWAEVKDAGAERIDPRKPVPPVNLPGDLRTYVALGDSYSSGEGVEPFTPATGDVADGGDNCHRSEDAYSQQLIFSDQVQVRFVACSGAVVDDMYEPQVTANGKAVSSVGSQLAAASLDASVGLVTLTIGGNDLGFAAVLRHCFVHHDCADDIFDDTFDDGMASELTLAAWADVRFPQVATEIYGLLRDIRSRAPNARILVLGYPNLTWSKWPDLQARDCVLDAIALGHSEANFILSRQQWFSEMIDQAASEVGAEFVHTAETFINHEPCGAVTPRWLDYIVIDNGQLNQATMHPNRNGHFILSRIVACYLWANPDPVDNYDADVVKNCALHGAPD